MVNEISFATRRRMIGEMVNHQEAAWKSSWELPPLWPGDHGPTYAEMMLDPSISYCVGLLQEAVVSAGWSLEPAGKSRRQLAVAAAVESDLKELPLPDLLHDALDALWRGFRAMEVSWKYVRGRHCLCDLAALDPDQVSLNLDDQMRVVSIVSTPVGYDRQVLRREKIWLHANRPSRTRPAGESVLEPAFRAYSSKNRLLQFWGISIQRFGMQSLKVTLPANTPTARQTQILNTLYQGRLDGVYLVPDDVLVEAMNPTMWANLTFEKSVDYQDAEICKAILFIHQPGGNATGQTYVTGAGLSEQARATSIRLQRISTSLARSFTEQVIRPLVASNFGMDPELVPQLRIGKPDAGRIVTMAVPLSQLVAAGVCDSATAAEQLDLPEPEVIIQQGLADHALTVRAAGSPGARSGGPAGGDSQPSPLS